MAARDRSHRQRDDAEKRSARSGKNASQSSGTRQRVPGGEKGNRTGGEKGPNDRSKAMRDRRPTGDSKRSNGRAGRTADSSAAESDNRSPHRERSGASNLIEGKHAVLEALESNIPIKTLLLQSPLEPTEDLKRIQSLAEQAGIPMKTLPRARLDTLSLRGAHQGVMAKIAPFSYRNIESIIDSCAGTGEALIVVLDHITDMGNFGAIIRTAEVVGASGIVIPNRRSVEVGADTYKTSAGAVSRMPIAQVPNLAHALELMKEAGFWVAGASEKADEECWDAPLSGRIALVMGSEGEGLSRLTLESCDLLVSLPQRGTIGSLNVAQAMTALSYEWMRQSRALSNASSTTGEEF